MNTQQLEERLADLKKQFREASTTLSSVDASPINPYEVCVALVTSDRSLNFPFRTHSQMIPHPIQTRAQSVSIASLTIYGIFDASKNADLRSTTLFGG